MYRKSRGKCPLRQRGLELGLLWEYWMALCGERVNECEVEEVLITEREWNRGSARRSSKGVRWMRLQ